MVQLQPNKMYKVCQFGRRTKGEKFFIYDDSLKGLPFRNIPIGDVYPDNDEKILFLGFKDVIDSEARKSYRIGLFFLHGKILCGFPAELREVFQEI